MIFVGSTAFRAPQKWYLSKFDTKGCYLVPYREQAVSLIPCLDTFFFVTDMILVQKRYFDTLFVIPKKWTDTCQRRPFFCCYVTQNFFSVVISLQTFFCLLLFVFSQRKKNKLQFLFLFSDRKTKRTRINNFFSFSLSEEQVKKTKQKEKAACFSFCFLIAKPFFLFKSNFFFFFFVMPNPYHRLLMVAQKGFWPNTPMGRRRGKPYAHASCEPHE